MSLESFFLFFFSLFLRKRDLKRGRRKEKLMKGIERFKKFTRKKKSDTQPYMIVKNGLAVLDRAYLFTLYFAYYDLIIP